MTDHIAADQSGVEYSEYKKWAEIHFRNEDEFTLRDYRITRDAWNAALSSNAAQSAGQEPSIIKAIYVEHDRIDARSIIEAVQDGDLDHTEAIEWIEKLIRHNQVTHPSSAAQVGSEIIALMMHSMSTEDGDADPYYNRGIQKCMDIVSAAMKTAAPSKGEGS